MSLLALHRLSAGMEIGPVSRSTERVAHTKCAKHVGAARLGRIVDLDCRSARRDGRFWISANGRFDESCIRSAVARKINARAALISVNDAVCECASARIHRGSPAFGPTWQSFVMGAEQSSPVLFGGNRGGVRL